MEYEITGDNLQLVTLHVQGGETVYAEAGAMNHMSSNMDMQAKAKGGLQYFRLPIVPSMHNFIQS